MESAAKTSQVTWPFCIICCTFPKILYANYVWPFPRLDHLVYDCAPRLSPLPASTYADEDMVGKIKQFALRSHPFRLGYQILQRYSAYCCCRWLRQLTGWIESEAWLMCPKNYCFSSNHYLFKTTQCCWSLPRSVGMRTCLRWIFSVWSKGSGHRCRWEGEGGLGNISVGHRKWSSCY